MMKKIDFPKGSLECCRSIGLADFEGQKYRPDLFLDKYHQIMSGKIEVPIGTLKKRAIKVLMNKFPNRKFVMVGDSGESDPEAYGDMARKFEGRVIAICIRQAPIRTIEIGGDREKQAFRDLDKPGNTVTIKIFDDPKELSDLNFTS